MSCFFGITEKKIQPMKYKMPSHCPVLSLSWSVMISFKNRFFDSIKRWQLLWIITFSVDTQPQVHLFGEKKILRSYSILDVIGTTKNREKNAQTFVNTIINIKCLNSTIKLWMFNIVWNQKEKIPTYLNRRNISFFGSPFFYIHI